MNLSFKETGRLTLTTFNKLYKHYKDNFDYEMMLNASHTTYANAYKKAMQQDEWF